MSVFNDELAFAWLRILDANNYLCPSFLGLTSDRRQTLILLISVYNHNLSEVPPLILIGLDRDKLILLHGSAQSKNTDPSCLRKQQTMSLISRQQRIIIGSLLFYQFSKLKLGHSGVWYTRGVS